jgi:hypothetical protein
MTYFALFVEHCQIYLNNSVIVSSPYLLQYQTSTEKARRFISSMHDMDEDREAINYQFFDRDNGYYDSDSMFFMFNAKPSPQFLSQEILESSIQRKQTKVRCPWGRGSEAALTAVYRQYDHRASPIFKMLQSRFPMVTVEVMHSLIDTIRESLPEAARPVRPPRAQRRSKQGLVIWLDQHADIVIRWLHVHPV